jgi:hypothetical protein
MRLPDRGQGLTLTENVGRGLILRTALPAQWAVCQPHQMVVPPQGVVLSKKSGNHPGLSPSKGQKPNPGAPTGPGDQLSSLSLGVPKIPSSSLVLVPQPVISSRPKILSRDPKAGSGPTKSEAEPFLASPSAVSLPRTPACPGTQ